MEKTKQKKANAWTICLLPYSRKITYFLAMLIFCLCIGGVSTVCHAYTETKGTVTAASAKIRDKADTSGAVLGSVSANDTVDICGEETGSDGFVWYQVYVNASTKGYIRSDLVNKAGDSSSSSTTSSTANTASTTTATSASLPETEVTAMDRTSGKVATDNVRIRSGASTSHDVVATAKRGLSVTVTGKAQGSDGKEWYQVTFSYNNEEITGFIRSDLVTFGEVETNASQTEITGTVGDGNEQGEQQMEETEVTTEGTETETENVTDSQETEVEDTSAAANTTTASTSIVLLNTEETPYVLPEFSQVILNWEGQEINAYKNGDFYLFYAQKDGGQEGWYLYDSTEGVYERYVYETATATVPKSGVAANAMLFVTFGIIIALLISVIIVMFLKMREMSGFGWHGHDDDDDDDDFGDDDDLEEEDDDEEEEEDIRGRKVSRSPERVPVRGTRMNPNMEQRPVRRPVREEDEEVLEERPVRRPVNPQGRPVNPQGRPVNPQGRAPQNRPVNPQARPVNPQSRPVAGQGRPAPQQTRRPEGQRPVRRTEEDMQVRRPKNFVEPEEHEVYQSEVRRPAAGQTGNVRTRRVQPQTKRESEDIEFIDI